MSERRSLLIVTTDDDFAERVTSTLFSRCSVMRGQPQHETLRAILDSNPVEAIIVDIDDVAWDGRNIADLVAGLRADQPTLPLIVASYNISASSLIPAMRAGANDVIDKDFAADDLIAQVDWLLQSRPARRGGQAAKVVAVCGVRAGIGGTTVSVGLAAELARRATGDQRVLLMDFGFPPAETPVMLGTKASYFMTDALGDIGRMDATLIDGAFAQVPSPHLYVLPLAADDDNAAIAAEGDLAQLVDVLKTYFSAIVIDINRPFNPRLADRLFLEAGVPLLVTDQSMTSINSASIMLDRQRRAIDREPNFALVVSRHLTRLKPSPEDVARALRAPGKPFLVPDDRMLVDAKRNLGTAASLDDAGAFARAIRAIVDATLGAEPSPAAEPAPAVAEEPSGLFHRLTRLSRAAR